MSPAMAIFVGALFPPEMPNSLVLRGHLEEACRVLEKVRGTHKVDAEFQDLKEASDAARAVTGTFRNLPMGRDRRRWSPRRKRTEPTSESPPKCQVPAATA